MITKMKGYDMYQNRFDGRLRLLEQGAPALPYDEWAWLGATPLFMTEGVANAWAERYIQIPLLP